jgi:NAD(P)-dependent dehydrogenase (short-subunit alcohol dehydrogenase family)
MRFAMPTVDEKAPASMSRFTSKVALVVGGGTSEGTTLEIPGVGEAISLLLAREGCRVAVLGQGKAGAARTVELIEREGGIALAIQGDASREEDCRKAVELVTSTFGRLDILVNNLGIRLSSSGVVDTSADEWDRVMGVNVRGLMLMAKYAVPHLPQGGSIINVSGIVAVRPTYTSSLAYATSKGAVNTLTIALAVQLARQGIRVNAICPGNIWTPLTMREASARGVGPNMEAEREERRRMIPLGIEGTAWDVASAALFLASDDARWVTGQLLTVDGGSLLPQRP